jgi:hypothetical protein
MSIWGSLKEKIYQKALHTIERPVKAIRDVVDEIRPVAVRARVGKAIEQVEKALRRARQVIAVPPEKSRPKSKPKSKPKEKVSPTPEKKPGVAERIWERIFPVPEPKKEGPEIASDVEAVINVGVESLEACGERAERLGTFAVWHEVHHYAYPDGCIDFELRIGLRPGSDIHEALIDLEDFFHAPPGYWISVGVRFPPTGIEEIDDTYITIQGEKILGAHYQGTEYAPDNFVQARALVDGLLTGRADDAEGYAGHGGSPTEIFIRLYWSPDGSRPKREGKKA